MKHILIGFIGVLLIAVTMRTTQTLQYMEEHKHDIAVSLLVNNIQDRLYTWPDDIVVCQDSPYGAGCAHLIGGPNKPINHQD